MADSYFTKAASRNVGEYRIWPNTAFVKVYTSTAYKTNLYGMMPLLHIIGVSPPNTTFSIAFCFMQNEQEESYKWALKTFFS